MMPSKPLAAKASVFNSNFVDDDSCTVAFTKGPKTDFTMIFPKCWASSEFFYGTIVGLEVHLGFVWTTVKLHVSIGKYWVSLIVLVCMAACIEEL